MASRWGLDWRGKDGNLAQQAPDKPRFTPAQGDEAPKPPSSASRDEPTRIVPLPPTGDSPTVAASGAPAAGLVTGRSAGGAADRPRDDSGAGRLGFLASDAIPGYEIEGEIHRGGQGVVYAAIQKATHRKVAIKVMHAGPFAGVNDLARFEREVRILAQLKHTNIVAIHDSGLAAGNFYYVMDYIAGEPPDAYAARRKWPIRESLALFVKICDAVTAAHMRGVIHRDLKPGNILIDEDGEPHILDFGLAKLSGDSVTDVTAAPAMTMAGQFVGSLPWAAPEQAEGRPDKIDVRTDVYSLGVVLYQMLTGVFPYETSGSLHQVLDNIRHHEPRPPCSLRSEIGDEVETIVLKSLAKEPDRRYQSAGELAADVRRYLTGDAIEAKRDSAWYVFRKSVRRYRVPLIIAGVFMVAGFGFGVVMAGFYQGAKRALGVREAQEAQRERDEAERREALGARRLYATRIALAQRKLDEGDVAEIRELLDECPGDLRGWEWNRLRWLSDRSVAQLGGHEHFVTGVAFSPDGKRLASSSFDNTVKLWNSADGREFSEPTTLKGHERPVLCVAFSSDGSRLASGGQDRIIHVWDAASGESVAALTGHWSNVSALAFLPDGRLVSAGHDQTVRIWDVAAGRELRMLEGHTDVLQAVAVSADGKWIASAGDDATIVLWDVQTGAKKATLTGHDGAIHALAFRPDNATLGSGGADQTIRLWDVAAGKEARVLRGHDERVRSLAFSQDGATLVSTSEDRTLRTWDVATGDAIVTYCGHAGGVDAVACSPTAPLLASGGLDNRVRLWDADGSDEVTVLSGHYGAVNAVSIAPDDGRIASAGQDFAVKLWDAAGGEEQRALRGHDWAVRGVAFVLNGTAVASGGNDGVVRIWPLRGEAAPRTLTGHDKNTTITCVASNADGVLILTTGEDHSVRLWGAETGKLLRSFAGHSEPVLAAAFRPDGKFIASGGTDKTARVWEVVTGRETLLRGHQAAVTAVAWSPDGAKVVTGSADNSVRIWNAAAGQEAAVLRGHRGTVRGVVWHPDGKRILSVSDDQTLRIWDALSGEEIVVLRGHRGPVLGVTVSSDGGSIVTCGQDGTLRLWEMHEAPPEVRVRRTTIAAARRAVDAAYRDLTFAAAVAARLREDISLPLPVREAALRIAAARGDNAQQLNDAAWQVAKQANRRPEQYEQALRMARRACELKPEIGSYLNTLGVALYRAGQYAEALPVFEQSIQRNGEHPADVAFLAMTQHKLNHPAEARQQLARLEKLMQQAWFAQGDLWQSFQREAERMIDGVKG